MRLCQPLALSCRDALLRILAHELRGRRDVGDGELHRIARTIIKENRLFDYLATISENPPVLLLRLEDVTYRLPARITWFYARSAIQGAEIFNAFRVRVRRRCGCDHPICAAP